MVYIRYVVVIWSLFKMGHAYSMIGENRQLVTNEPVEIGDCRKITGRFRGIYRMYPNLMKENRRMLTCNRFGLANTWISTSCTLKSSQLMCILDPCVVQRGSRNNHHKNKNKHLLRKDWTCFQI